MLNFFIDYSLFPVLFSITASPAAIARSLAPLVERSVVPAALPVQLSIAGGKSRSLFFATSGGPNKPALQGIEDHDRRNETTPTPGPIARPPGSKTSLKCSAHSVLVARHSIGTPGTRRFVNTGWWFCFFFFFPFSGHDHCWPEHTDSLRNLTQTPSVTTSPPPPPFHVAGVVAIAIGGTGPGGKGAARARPPTSAPIDRGNRLQRRAAPGQPEAAGRDRAGQSGSQRPPGRRDELQDCGAARPPHGSDLRHRPATPTQRRRGGGGVEEAKAPMTMMTMMIATIMIC